MVEENAPIIVKRARKKGKGHGGAWKVAFADFATAMMAFFMVLWLSANTSQEQKKAISGYFEDPVGFTEGGKPTPIDLGGSPELIEKTAPTNSPPVENIPLKEEDITQMADDIEQRQLMDLLKTFQEQIDASEKLSEFKDQLLLDITEEGLRIQIVDKSKRPMFDSGKSELKFYSEDILFELAKTIAKVPNKLSLTGHTDAQPFAGGDHYSNWELSADRANAARRALVEGGVPEDQISRVVGLSSSVLFDNDDPSAAVNRRIAIILLNKKAERQITKNASNTEASLPAEPVKDENNLKNLQEGNWFDEMPAPVTKDDVTW